MEVASNKTHLFLLILVVFLFVSKTSGHEYETHELYVKRACSTTTYPGLCNRMLPRYASLIKSDPVMLCRTALVLTLKSTVKVYSSIAKIIRREGLSKVEAGILRDCKEEMLDTFDELRQSIHEMKTLKRAKAKAHLENLKTWVSAALTDEDTCIGGFDELPAARAWLKQEVKKEVEKLEKVTSNTLSLINSLHY